MRCSPTASAKPAESVRPRSNHESNVREAMDGCGPRSGSRCAPRGGGLVLRRGRHRSPRPRSHQKSEAGRRNDRRGPRQTRGTDGARCFAPHVGGAGPTIVMLCGLQGSGKTTTCGKLAARWKNEGRKVLVAAADLQRPAAVEQLQTVVQGVESTGRGSGQVAFHGEPERAPSSDGPSAKPSRFAEMPSTEPGTRARCRSP